MSVKQDRDGSWQYDIWLGGRKGGRVRKKGFLTERAALDAVAVAREDYRRQPSLPLKSVDLATIGDTATKWIDRLEKRNRHPRHVKAVRRAFLRLGEMIGLDRPATEMTGEKLEEFIAKREEKVKRATAFLDMIHVRAALRYAAGKMPGLEKWMAPNISEDLPRPKSMREREISKEEESKLIAAMMDAEDLAMADLLMLAIDTGMRVSEIFELRWPDVHAEPSRFLPHGWLMVRATKTGNRSTGETDNRRLKITARAAIVFESRRAASDRVFSKRFNHWRRLEAACKRCGIPYGETTPNGIVFHDTRHTKISRMLRDGADPQSVMDVVGHKNIATTMKYAHSTEESRARAIEPLEPEEWEQPDEPKDY